MRSHCAAAAAVVAIFLPSSNRHSALCPSLLGAFACLVVAAADVLEVKCAWNGREEGRNCRVSNKHQHQQG